LNINITQAVDEIKAGKTIAYPTEAVYGLGCDPFNESAFNNLLTLKQRNLSKGVILIAANIAQLLPYVLLKNQPWEEKVQTSWQDNKQAITWILPATENVPIWLTGGRKTLAVRVTHHEIVKSLCEKLNIPIVSTSANLSQQAPALSAKECQTRFSKISVLEGKLLGLKHPSQIWNAITQQQLR